MIRNYFLNAIRFLKRNTVHTLINICGLALGMGCCLIIALYVTEELSYDSFHKKSDKLYRAWFRFSDSNGPSAKSTQTPFPLAAYLTDNFSEVEDAVRFISIYPWITVGEKRQMEKVTFVSRTFFHAFDFKDPNNNITHTEINPKDAFVTTPIAKRYFGDDSPIGKSISIQIGNQFEDFTIAGVVEQAPSNSSIQFDVLISDQNVTKLYGAATVESEWVKGFPETYVLLKPGADPSQITSRFKNVAKRLINSDQIHNYEVGLQPIVNMHFDDSFPNAFTPRGNRRNVFILSGMAMLLLILACVNFVTMSIGISLRRGKEVGVRKTIGAQRRQLIAQFLGETFITATISLAVGVLFCFSTLPLFNELSGKTLHLEFDWIMFVFGLGILLVVGAMAGSYPALYLSGLNPISVLKNETVLSDKQTLRRILVTGQLILSIFLVSSALAMKRQLEYVQSKDIGFNADNLISVPMNIPQTGNLIELVTAGFNKSKQFESMLSQSSDLSTCMTMHDLGTGRWTRIEFVDDHDSQNAFNLNIVDANFLSVMRLSLVAGRNFSEDGSDAETSIIVNESFVKHFGIKTPIGDKIPGEKFFDHKIIGVVKDFNYSSLYDKIQPLVMAVNLNIPLSGMSNIVIASSPIPKLLIRYPTGADKKVNDKITAAWKELSQGQMLTIRNVKESLDAQYRSDKNLSRMVEVASTIATLVGLFGLYALAALSMQTRAKEITIRKVLGASQSLLLLTLLKSYLYIIGIGIVLSIPFTYYFANEWMQSFEYKAPPSVLFFLKTGFISIVTGVLVITYQTLSVARSQPAKVLSRE